ATYTAATGDVLRRARKPSRLIGGEPVTTVLPVTKPDISVADAEAVIDEALAYIDEQRVGLTEIMADIRDEGGAFGYALAQIVGPYVSKESCLSLFKPSAQRFWAGPAKVT